MMDLYGTHQRLLVKYMMQTTGPVIELGAGNYSTPILHEIAAAQGRHLATVDNNPEWLSKFEAFENAGHTLTLLKSWDDFVVTDPHGLAFVDHADPPGHPRWLQVQKLLPVAGVIVIHDTEDDLYGYAKLMGEIDVIDEDTTHKTHTRVIRRKHGYGPESSG
jgi:predicted O-methyltransferase YrrM